MKKSNSMVSLTLTALLSLSLISCGNDSTNNQKAESSEHDHSKMEHSNDEKMMETSSMAMDQSQSVTDLVNHYLAIKNALVDDDAKGASVSGEKLAKSASEFDVSSVATSNQTEITEILEVLKEHGEHIAESEIDHQREHFEGMAKDFVDLLEITGTDRTLYQQYCPMYNNNQGGYWLSASKEIKNPLFGSKMLTCGKVTKEL